MKYNLKPGMRMSHPQSSKKMLSMYLSQKLLLLGVLRILKGVKLKYNLFIRHENESPTNIWSCNKNSESNCGNEWAIDKNQILGNDTMSKANG